MIYCRPEAPGVADDIVEGFLGVEHREDLPGHLLRLGGVVDIGSALAEVQVVEAGQLTEHDVTGPGNERIGGVVGPVVTIQHRVLGDLAAGAELGIRIRPDYAIVAVILVIALGGVVEVIGPTTTG